MSGVDVVMTGMPGMDHHEPMKMTGVKSSLAPDGVTLVAKLPRALPAGTRQLARRFQGYASRFGQAQLLGQVMGETLVWLRWLQFIDLGLVFGAGMSARLLGQRFATGHGRWVLVGLYARTGAGSGRVRLYPARMADTPVGELDPHRFR
jgi:hypothetical protein